MIELDKKISAFVKLGEYLRREKVDSKLSSLIVETENNNRWFTFKNSLHALKVWGNTLRRENILKWIHKYKLVNKKIKVENKIKIGI